jgi:hypothetical protein
MLAERVASGDLPTVEERLPANPIVIEPNESLGEYGGIWHRAWRGINDFHAYGRITYAGDLILYPSTSLHHVRPVTRGSRICSFFWIQSMIRDDAQRTLLFDLDVGIQRLANEIPDHPSAVQLTGVYHNLLRMWADV